MNINFQINFTGIPDQDDLRAARQAIFVENRRLAMIDPPGNPLSPTTLAEIKVDYLSLLDVAVTDIHKRNILNAKTQAISMRFSDAQLKEIFGNLIDQLDNGATVDAVIAKTV